MLSVYCKSRCGTCLTIKVDMMCMQVVMFCRRREYRSETCHEFLETHGGTLDDEDVQNEFLGSF